MFLLMASEAFSIMLSTLAFLSYYMDCRLGHTFCLHIRGLKHPHSPEQHVSKFNTRKTAALIPNILHYTTAYHLPILRNIDAISVSS